MIFASPWLLLALPALPVLWWLLRVVPPAPRTETFPAIRLLAGLRPREETPARTPWWLLLLRLTAAALVILGLADPVLHAGGALPGQGPVLLVLDNGWSAAADWSGLQRAADQVLDRAGRAGRHVALLTTAPGADGAAPAVGPETPPAEMRGRIAALHPAPWPADHAAAAQALRKWTQGGGGKAGGAAVSYVSDGVAQKADGGFFQALAAAGPVTEIRPDPPRARMLLTPGTAGEKLVARVAQLPQPAPTRATVLAQSGDGRTLARTAIDLPPGATAGQSPIDLPLELRNQLGRLVLEGPASAGAVMLLDERWRRRPVGLATADTGADVPLIGALYYLHRALAPYAELRDGPVAQLMDRQVSVLVLADEALAGAPDREAITRWVEKGGMLVRFAGPRLAEETASGEAKDDRLLPVPLLAGDRQLGGALSWGKPEPIAPFPHNSPFAGLAVPPDVTVTRQVLAAPTTRLGAETWARLADGTPLVTAAPLGAGRVVLFHVTANADWSNLPLSGLFVDMMRRIVQLSAGVAPGPEHTMLAPAETLDGFGTLGTPPQAARPLAADAFATTQVSPAHPPGLYGPENDRRSLNLAAALPPLAVAAPVPGARVTTLAGLARARALGPWLLAAALALMVIDMLIALRLRGLLGGWLRPAALSILLLGAGAALPARAADSGAPDPMAAALHTSLAYVKTGDAQVDELSRSGLAGLSDYVNQRTAASLSAPVGVVPGQDDLSVYPLLYWPVTADSPSPSPEMVAALNTYMRHDGIILIDTQGGGPDGSGQGFAQDVDGTLKRATQGLEIPPLAPLTNAHVLTHTFYLLSEFPGRYVGDTVWVQRDQDRANDSVSPVIIGYNDWAAAWAAGPDGQHPYATIPGGARQRTFAYRFGVNLVMYALTGNYKGDQVHIPAILERLGQ